MGKPAGERWWNGSGTGGGNCATRGIRTGWRFIRKDSIPASLVIKARDQEEGSYGAKAGKIWEIKLIYGYVAKRYVIDHRRQNWR